jgi:hypothetical protein
MKLLSRSNPTLCHRSTSGIAQQQQELVSSDETDEALAIHYVIEALAVNDATRQTESGRDDDARPMRKRKRKAPDYLRY